MNLAIVWDGLATTGGAGGAERVLEELHALFPEAPIYTTVFNPRRMPPHFATWDIRPSFIQRLPLATRFQNLYLPLMPAAVEAWDLSAYDLVISGSYAVAKGVVTGPETFHLCYCFTPIRYAWEQAHDYLRHEGFGRLARWLIPPGLAYLRLWDEASARRVDRFLAISHNTARRIQKRYRRPADVIYPPVDTEFFQPGSGQGDYFLVVSRLVSYKRVDVAVEAFNRLGLPLHVIGDGAQRARLAAMARPNVRFLGRQPAEVVREQYQACRALIFPPHEDFGLVPVEAQAAGRPVIAYGAGGALETVVEGETGLFFRQQSPEALVEAIAAFQDKAFDSAAIRRHALRFDRQHFRRRIREVVDEAVKKEPV